jgi:signal transduction histidine kinase
MRQGCFYSAKSLEGIYLFSKNNFYHLKFELPIPGTEKYTALPAFARFILEYHLEDFVREQLTLSRAVDVPLLKFLRNYSDEELVEISIPSSKELLEFLANNNPKEQIHASLNKWLKNQLGIIGKFEIGAEDITLINYVRGKTMRSFLPKYISDKDSMLLLIEEIESYLINSSTISANAYIQILKEEVSKRENELLQAQEIGHIGSFEWSVDENKLTKSPQVDIIYEGAPQTGLDNFITSVHSEDQEQVRKSFSNAYTSGEYECEYRYIVHGKTKYLWSKGRVNFQADGKPLKLSGVIQDITNRKKIELELQEKTDALSRSNANLEQFAYAASHDLKEPIRKIRTFSDRLKGSLDERLSDAERAMFQRLDDASVRMSDLIDDLLSYSQASITLNEFEDISLEQIINGVLTDLEISIEEKTATIKKSALPVIKGNSRQMQQLFQNLISNALKYSKPDQPPIIEISSSRIRGTDFPDKISASDEQKSFYLIRVKDNGIGFNQSEAERIFNIFQRLHGRTEYQGTGVGLAIAQKVVENHNGYIWANSEHDFGAEFNILLPDLI